MSVFIGDLFATTGLSQEPSDVGPRLSLGGKYRSKCPYFITYHSFTLPADS